MNILLFVFDALRADHVGAYGYDRNTTPALDSLAENGVLFENCISPATWTRPAAASILTGLYPPVHGTRAQSHAFNPPLPTLSALFSESGYQTVGMGSMPNIQGDHGFSKGFDEYIDLFKTDLVQSRRTETHNNVPMTRAEDITDAFIEWVQTRESENNFFALLWNNETHAPYSPPEAFREYTDPDYDGQVDGSPESFKHASSSDDIHQLKALYDGEIEYADACFAELRDRLQDLGEWDETLAVCMADHGDGLGEHPGFFGHGIKPFEGLIHVPLIIRPPTDVSDVRYQGQTSLVDLYPTILQYCPETNLSPELESRIQGDSMADKLRGVQSSGSQFVFVDGKTYDEKEQYRVVRSNDWKLIDVCYTGSETISYVKLAKRTIKSGKVFDILQNPLYYYRRHVSSVNGYLFDLAGDPDEQENLIESAPETRRNLEQTLEEWETECESLRAELDVDPETVAFDSRTEERLKQLGYLE